MLTFTIILAVICLALFIVILCLVHKLRQIAETKKCIMLPRGMVLAFFPYSSTAIMKNILIVIDGVPCRTFTFCPFKRIVNASLAIFDKASVKNLKNVCVEIKERRGAETTILMKDILFLPKELIIIKGD